jgi:16S rRNA (guanine527-N7)-methyltransferase
MSGADAIRAVCEAAGMQEPSGWGSFFDVVQAWDARTDLTSARTNTELAEILFLDAAHAIAAGWPGRSASLVDIGAGVGAPTIPILLSDETLSGTLVEPRRIRTAFLRTAAGTVGIAGRTTMLEEKVDPAKPAVDGAPFGVALSRATFAPEEWLPIGARLADEVWVLTAGTEVAATGDLRLHRRLDYQVPSSGAPRSILAYRREPLAVTGAVAPV